MSLTGDAINRVTSALQGAPMLLVLLLINISTLGVITWLTVKAAEGEAIERAGLIKLLDRCLMPPPTL